MLKEVTQIKKQKSRKKYMYIYSHWIKEIYDNV
jgi:hypothetical protein